MSKALVLKGADFSANKLDTVIVTDPVPCTGISLSASTASVEVGQTVTLTATVTPNDTTDSVVWSSSDQTKATVANGVVTGVGKGSVTITATCGNFSATCTVAVVAYYKTPVLGSVYATSTALDYSPASITQSKGTFNDPFIRKVLNGQTVSVSAVGSSIPGGLYVTMLVYTGGTFSQYCTASGDNYVLTQEMLDSQSSHGILSNSTQLYSYGQYLIRWAGNYTATQDCYVVFWYNRDGISDISSDLDAIANAINISIE